MTMLARVIPTMYSNSVKAAVDRFLVNVTLHSILGDVCAHLQRLRDVAIGPKQVDPQFAHVACVLRVDRSDIRDHHCAVVNESAVSIASCCGRIKWGCKCRRDETVGIDLFPG